MLLLVYPLPKLNPWKKKANTKETTIGNYKKGTINVSPTKYETVSMNSLSYDFFFSAVGAG